MRVRARDASRSSPHYRQRCGAYQYARSTLPYLVVSDSHNDLAQVSRAGARACARAMCADVVIGVKGGREVTAKAYEAADAAAATLPARRARLLRAAAALAATLAALLAALAVRYARARRARRYRAFQRIASSQGAPERLARGENPSLKGLRVT